jgi:hypothetical protein
MNVDSTLDGISIGVINKDAFLNEMPLTVSCRRAWHQCKPHADLILGILMMDCKRLEFPLQAYDTTVLISNCSKGGRLESPGSTCLDNFLDTTLLLQGLLHSSQDKYKHLRSSLSA